MAYTLWFTGLPAAGKSTVARLVADALRARGERVELLDGDEIRRHLSYGLGFSRADREENLRRIAYVADLLSRNHVHVITAAISPFRSARDETRLRLGERFVEIFVNAPLEVCARRDPKGLYAKAFAGEIQNFTGVSDPYEPPLNPELVLQTGAESTQESAAKVLAYLDAAALEPSLDRALYRARSASGSTSVP
jgi:adenylylsulfate kinase